MNVRWTHALFPAALMLLLVTYVRFEPVQWAHYTDPVVYLSGAQSLAEGEGYRYAPYVNTPRIGCHPPLQSAYLSLFWRLNSDFPNNVPLLFGAMIFLALAAFTLFYLIAVRSGVPPWLTTLLILAWGFTDSWGTLIYAFFSDILFSALWLGLSLYWLNEPNQTQKRTWLITGLFLALLYLTRSAAMPLIAIVALVLYRRARRGGAWLPLLCSLSPVALAVMGWKLYKTGSAGYVDFIVGRISEAGGGWGIAWILVDNAYYYLSGLGLVETLLPSFVTFPSAPGIGTSLISPILIGLTMLVGWALTACWIYGCWWKGKPLDRMGGWLVVAYLAQLTLYPAHLGERALFPILPFILIWAWKGRSLLFRWPAKEKFLVGAAGAALVVGSVGNAIGFAQSMGYLRHSHFSDDLAEIGAWLRTNTPPETVVAAALSEPVFHLHHLSERRIIENYFQPHPWLSVASYSLSGTPRAEYMLLSWYSWMALEESNFNRFELVLQSSRSHYRLYRAGLKSTTR